MIAHPISDIQIIQQLKQKDRQVITIILEKYGDVLYGNIYQKVTSEKIAKVTMQTVFLRIWQEANLFDETKERFLLWLLKIMNQVVK